MFPCSSWAWAINNESKWTASPDFLFFCFRHLNLTVLLGHSAGHKLVSETLKSISVYSSTCILAVSELLQDEAPNIKSRALCSVFLKKYCRNSFPAGQRPRLFYHVSLFLSQSSYYSLVSYLHLTTVLCSLLTAWAKLSKTQDLPHGLEKETTRRYNAKQEAYSVLKRVWYQLGKETLWKCKQTHENIYEGGFDQEKSATDQF